MAGPKVLCEGVGSSQPAEEVADIGDEEVRLFQGREMAAVIHVDPADDGVLFFCESSYPNVVGDTSAAVGTPLLALAASQVALCPYPTEADELAVPVSQYVITWSVDGRG